MKENNPQNNKKEGFFEKYPPIDLFLVGFVSIIIFMACKLIGLPHWVAWIGAAIWGWNYQKIKNML